jgi:hypothetical protein
MRACWVISLWAFGSNITQLLRDGYTENRMRELRPCGTWAAYQRHEYRGEEPCAACKEARVLKQRENYHKHRDKNRKRKKQYYKTNRWRWNDQHYKRSYGLLQSERAELFELQDHRCAIGVLCEGKKLTLREMNVDHCHRIEARDGSAVRGLCCHMCNKVLGIAGDSLDGIRAFRSKLKEFERYLTRTFPETQRRIAAMRAKR